MLPNSSSAVKVSVRATPATTDCAGLLIANRNEAAGPGFTYYVKSAAPGVAAQAGSPCRVTGVVRVTRSRRSVPAGVPSSAKTMALN